MAVTPGLKGHLGWNAEMAFFYVRPAGRTHLEVKVLYGP
jgi:hypothetical protein